MGQVGHPGGEEVKEAVMGMGGEHEPAPVGALPSAQGSRSQNMRREAAVGAPPFVCHSIMLLCFCGNLPFLNKHPWL